MGKLRCPAPTQSETLEIPILEKLLGSLFPAKETHDPREFWREGVVPEGYREVTTGEVIEIFKRGNPGSAPGPDGVFLRILRRLPREAVEVIADTFSRCLRDDIFPGYWKTSILVLIPQGSKQPSTTVKARPTYLLILMIWARLWNKS